MIPAIGQRWMFSNNKCTCHFDAKFIGQIIKITDNSSGTKKFYTMKVLQFLPGGRNERRNIGDEFNYLVLDDNCGCWIYLKGQDKSDI